MQQLATRRRIEGLVRKRFGELSTLVVRRLAQECRVSYTTLARFLLYGGRQRTSRLRRGTLDRMALFFDVNPTWLTTGQGTRQLDLWPILVSADAEARVDGPIQELERTVAAIRMLPESVAVQACRAAVAATIDVCSARGVPLPAEVYRGLMRLYALQRPLGRLAEA